MTQRLVLLLTCPKASEVRAMVPPSPRLLARMIMNTYLMVTTRIKAQMISDKTAKTLFSETPPEASIDCLNA